MLNLAKTVTAILGCLAAGDVAGVVACIGLDLGSPRFFSAPLPYAVWFVVGVFTGLAALNAAGAWTAPDRTRDWDAQPGAARRGAIIVAIAVVVMVALSLLFHALFWSRRVLGEYYVPDSLPHTLVFFVSVGASMAFFRSVLTTPDPR